MILPPPSTAWQPPDDLMPLDTRDTWGLERRGYRRNPPAGAEVPSVSGIVPASLMDEGVQFVWDTDTEALFRFAEGAWRCVNGKTDATLEIGEPE